MFKAGNYFWKLVGSKSIFEVWFVGQFFLEFHIKLKYTAWIGQTFCSEQFYPAKWLRYYSKCIYRSILKLGLTTFSSKYSDNPKKLCPHYFFANKSLLYYQMTIKLFFYCTKLKMINVLKSHWKKKILNN